LRFIHLCVAALLLQVELLVQRRLPWRETREPHLGAGSVVKLLQPALRAADEQQGPTDAEPVA
jgi:hypothetical protein